MAILEKEFELLCEGEAGKHIKFIKIEGLYHFLKDALISYGDTNKLLVANRIVDLTEKMLIKKKQITNNDIPSYVEVIKVAGLLHNLFYDGTVSSLFVAREKLEPLAVKHGIPDNYINAMFQTIESQLGDDTPVPQCKPVSGTPTELFAWACWYVDELHGNKKMPALHLG